MHLLYWILLGSINFFHGITAMIRQSTAKLRKMPLPTRYGLCSCALFVACTDGPGIIINHGLQIAHGLLECILCHLCASGLD